MTNVNKLQNTENCFNRGEIQPVHSALPDLLLLLLLTLVTTLHIVCGQHAGLSGPLHSAVHPALIDGLSVDDDVPIPERDLVVVLSRIVVQRPVNTRGGRVWRRGDGSD